MMISNVRSEMLVQSISLCSDLNIPVVSFFNVNTQMSEPHHRRNGST